MQFLHIVGYELIYEGSAVVSETSAQLPTLRRRSSLEYVSAPGVFMFFMMGCQVWKI